MAELEANLRRASYWFSELSGQGNESFPAMSPLEKDREADVCIVGAGYTGLWLAYELLRQSPGIRVAIVEARYPGYGASGRNGGAVIPRINGSREFWASVGGDLSVKALEKALIETVDQVEAAVTRENIDCRYTRAGMLEVARTELELSNLISAVEQDRKQGHDQSHIRILTPQEVSARVMVEGALGAKFTSNAASVQPAALVVGLANAVVRLGGTIYCNSPAVSVQPNLVTTERANVRSKYVVSAAEAYSESIKTEARRLVPVHTSMLVTEKLTDEQFDRIGWQAREVLLAEHPFLHLQRTGSGRITIGGDDNRLTYKYGSAPCPDGQTDSHVRAMYEAELVKLFPSLKGVKIEQSWQGVFGARRDWAPAVGLDRDSGVAWIGGYVGEGLAASNLAARTLVDLILGRETSLTALPLVRRRPRNWEPEPFRMIGATAILKLRHMGDSRERSSGEHSQLVAFANRLAGFTGFTG